MEVTIIGLGKMVSAIAKRLLLAKLTLTVFNRTKAKMQPLIELGQEVLIPLKKLLKMLILLLPVS